MYSECSVLFVILEFTGCLRMTVAFTAEKPSALLLLCLFGAPGRTSEHGSAFANTAELQQQQS